MMRPYSSTTKSFRQLSAKPWEKVQTRVFACKARSEEWSDVLGQLRMSTKKNGRYFSFSTSTKPASRSETISFGAASINGTSVVAEPIATFRDSDNRENQRAPVDRSNNKEPHPQRIWRAPDYENNNNSNNNESNGASSATQSTVWNHRVVDTQQQSELHALFSRLEAQEQAGGRLRQRGYGVLHHDPSTDIQLLTDNYTVKSIASALRDREDALQYAAVLAEQGKIEELHEFLQIYHPRHVLDRRYRKQVPPNTSEQFSPEEQEQAALPNDVTKSLHRGNLELIRKTLMRRPRTITQAHKKRAGVVIALCTVNQVPCVLLEKRAAHLRAHPDEVCLPGGMVCDARDKSIVSTCLREMREEIGGLEEREPDILGVLRCNWGEIHHLVNVAVTPVVVSWGELPADLHPSPDEVSQVFTVPLASLLDKSLWVKREELAPVFVGGPEVIWGLCGYILERFTWDVLIPNSQKRFSKHSMEEPLSTRWMNETASVPVQEVLQRLDAQNNRPL